MYSRILSSLQAARNVALFHLRDLVRLKKVMDSIVNISSSNISNGNVVAKSTRSIFFDCVNADVNSFEDDAKARALLLRSSPMSRNTTGASVDCTSLTLLSAAFCLAHLFEQRRVDLLLLAVSVYVQSLLRNAEYASVSAKARTSSSSRFAVLQKRK